MKYIIILLLVISAYDCFGQLFQKSFGAGNTHNEGREIFIAPDSGFYLFGDTGSFHRNLQIIKTNVQGDSIWSKYPIPSNARIEFTYCQKADKGFTIIYSNNSVSSVDTIYILEIDSACDFESIAFFTDTNTNYLGRVIQTNDSTYL